MKVTRDMHTHTNLSACADRTTTLALLAEAAAGLGIDTLGVANHLWDKNVPGASGWVCSAGCRSRSEAQGGAYGYSCSADSCRLRDGVYGKRHACALTGKRGAV